MTMLKGYTIPTPGSADGEYGSFGYYSGGAGGFSDYADSPAERPYWAGQRIARTIPALNGFGDREEMLEEGGATLNYGPTPQEATAAKVSLGTIALGAIIGYALGRNPIAATLGAGLGFIVGKPAGAALSGFDLTSTIKSTVALPARTLPGARDTSGVVERTAATPPSIIPVNTPPPSLQADPSVAPVLYMGANTGMSAQTMLLAAMGVLVVGKVLLGK